jgi:hypothetical protein
MCLQLGHFILGKSHTSGFFASTRHFPVYGRKSNSPSCQQATVSPTANPSP